MILALGIICASWVALAATVARQERYRPRRMDK